MMETSIIGRIQLTLVFERLCCMKKHISVLYPAYRHKYLEILQTSFPQVCTYSAFPEIIKTIVSIVENEILR